MTYPFWFIRKGNNPKKNIPEKKLPNKKGRFVYSATFWFFFSIVISASTTTEATPEPNIHLTSPASSNINDKMLQKQKSRYFDSLKTRALETLPSVSLNTLYIALPSIQFDKRWEREFRFKVSKNHKHRIQSNYAKILKQQLTSALDQDFNIVEDAKSADISLNAKIEDLYINGPETIQLQESFVQFAGWATLRVSVTTQKTSNTNDRLLLTLKDHENTQRRGFFRPVPTNRLLNQRDFRTLMQRWSRQLRKQLKLLPFSKVENPHQ